MLSKAEERPASLYSVHRAFEIGDFVAQKVVEELQKKENCFIKANVDV